MEILFLGTSSGTPSKSRNVSALAIWFKGSRQWYLVDCGEGTQHRLLHTGLSLFNLSAIFITHAHGDHCYGLPGLLASAGMLNRTQCLYIASPPAVKRFIEGALESTHLQLPYPLEYINIEENGQSIDVPGEFLIRATALSHRLPSFSYSFSEKNVEGKLDTAKLGNDAIPAGPLWKHIQQGKDVLLPNGRIAYATHYLFPRRNPRKVIVGGDNDTPELLADEAQAADVLVHEATYTQDVLDKIGPGPQHSSAKKVAQFANDANIRNLVLTHFSPRYHGSKTHESSLSAIESEAKSFYKGNLILANDLDHYSLNKQGMLTKPEQGF